MAMQTVYLKEHGGITHNSMGQLSSTQSVPWWSAFGSQSAYGEGGGQLKHSTMEHLISVGQLPSAKPAGRGTEQGGDKGDATQFTIFPGDCKTSGGGQKPQVAMSLHSAPSEYHSRFDLAFGQPMICTKYPYVDQCYGLFPTYGAQVSGRIMLPLDLTADEGPIYVNAKQYHGIIRRRQSRAKAVLENKVPKTRKPYMHHSRHLHAMRRPRGCGGRFLNTKSSNNEKGDNDVKKADDGEQSKQIGSPNSEVLQSESRPVNASREANGNGSNLSGSEVTSMYVQGGFERFPINHLGPSLHSFSEMMDSQREIAIPNKWVAAADGCCTLKV
ncbi:hypothetical protein SLA2020_122230 [Shorea laevis]